VVFCPTKYAVCIGTAQSLNRQLRLSSSYTRFAGPQTLNEQRDLLF